MDVAEEVKEFYERARESCQWAEQAPGPQVADTVRALRLIASLYQLALLLPEAEPDDLGTEGGLTKLASKAIYERFKALPIQYYAEIFDPVADPPEAAVTGDLADDLRDIYLDLKEGLQYYAAGRTQEAVFQWRTSFGSHWGRHATSALRVLHCYETRH